MGKKNKFKLSKNLKSQTTPYPNIHKILKRGTALFSVLVIIGIFFVINNDPASTTTEQDQDKQILGEQADNKDYEVYQVKSGDTLFNISRRYSVSLEKLAEINALEEPYTLKQGQEIKIPK